jgi:hypothetical protein
MAIIKNLGFTTLVVLGIICVIIPIVFMILYYSYPKNTKGREGYGYLFTFSLWNILSIGIIFFILAALDWIVIKRSAQQIHKVSAKKGIITPPRRPSVAPRAPINRAAV